MTRSKLISNKETRLFYVSTKEEEHKLLLGAVKWIDPLRGRATISLSYPACAWMLDVENGFSLDVVYRECEEPVNPDYGLGDVLFLLSNCQVLRTRIPDPVIVYSKDATLLSLVFYLSCSISVRKEVQ